CTSSSQRALYSFPTRRSSDLFMAFDDTTGEVLWETRLSNLPNGFPITYEVDGTQYVAVPVGRGSGPSNAFAVFTPDIVNPPGGNALFVFKLRDQGATD